MGAATAAGFVALAFGEPAPASCHSYRGGGHYRGTCFAHPFKQLLNLLLLFRLQGLDLSQMPVRGKEMMVHKIREHTSQEKRKKIKVH